MTQAPSIVWFRQDLRLADNPAVQAAIQKGAPIVFLYIWAPAEEGEWSPGAASRWWIYHALEKLQADLKALNSHLIILQGASLEVLEGVIAKTGAGAVYWNRRYEPEIIKRDAHIKAALHSRGIKASSFNGSLLFEPWECLNKQGKPYQVFTPFWKECIKEADRIQAPLPSPEKLSTYTSPDSLASESLDKLGLLPRIPWDSGFYAMWPKKKSAEAFLTEAIENVIGDYLTIRDFPASVTTSELSPFLHSGMISPRQIWATVQAHGNLNDKDGYLRQLGWREFANHLLYHFPLTTNAPLRTAFNNFPWRSNESNLVAWQKGLTGYPIVDAGMKELWATGWMHNRVRLIAGSFLVKDLRIHWLEGAKWFWETLVDADLANNTMGWQWVAGCGADAAPYFRIFNPITQGEKFDPDGNYVRKWVKELRKLPAKWIHKPWEAPAEVLAAAGVYLGKNYPEPMVDHAAERLQALDAYRQISSSSTHADTEV